MKDDENDNVLGLVCAAWILACNDDDERISYRGLQYRLRLPNEQFGRDLVARHAELFRHAVPARRVDSWKVKVRTSGKMPAWIRNIPEGAQREAAIDALTTEDFFRSQFRAQEDAERSDIEIVDWGLSHLERVYKAAAEKKEERTRRFSTLWIPLGSMLITIVALGTSAAIQVRGLSAQRELTQYEVSFRPKQEAYASLMTGLAAAFDSTLAGNVTGARQSGELARRAFVQLEPFLLEPVRTSVEQGLNDALALNESMAIANKLGKRDLDHERTFTDLQRRLRSTLYTALFGQ